MLIPAWLLALLFALYAAEYVWRFFKQPKNRYISLGKAIVRLTLAFVYAHIEIGQVSINQSQILLRYSLTLFVMVDLLFVTQEHLMRRYIK